MIRVNLATDPSLRSGTTAAFAPVAGSTLSITTSYSHYGTYGLVVSKANVNGSGVQIASPIPVTAALPYAFSVYTRLPITIPESETAEILLEIQWLDSINTVIRTNMSASLLMDDDSTWYRIGGVWTAPVGATFVNIQVIQPLPGTSGAKIILDSLLVEQATHVGGYFDDIPQALKNAIVAKGLTAVPQVLNGVRLGADIAIDDLVLNTIDEDDTIWVVTDLDGWWGQSEPELPDIARGTEDGSYDVEGRTKARIVTLTGFFIPKDTDSSLNRSLDRLIESTNLVRRGGWLMANESPTKAAWVRLTSKPSIQTTNARGKTEFQISFRASDPIKYHWSDDDPDGFTYLSYQDSTLPKATYTNLCINPTFTVNTTNWFVSTGVSGIAVTNSAPGSTAALEATGNQHGQSIVGYGSTLSNAVPVVPGVTLYAEGLVRVPAGTRLSNAYLAWFDGSNTQVGVNQIGPNVTVTSTAWTQVAMSAIPPSGAVYAIVYWCIQNAASSGEKWWLDRVAIQSGTNSGYFDGSFTSTDENTYAWTGTANASTSIKNVFVQDTVTNIGTATVSGLFTITGPIGAGSLIYNASTDETMELQQPLRGAGVVATPYEVESSDNVATIRTTAPHNLRVGDEVSLVGMIIPFSATDETRIVTQVSNVFPYSFSIYMPTDDIDTVSTSGQVLLTNNDTLVVDTYNRSVTYNGEVSGHRYRLTTLTDWIHFAPGINIIEFYDNVTEVGVISKQLSGNKVTLVMDDAHFLIPGEAIHVELPVVQALARKSLTSNVITLTTAEPHGFSVGDSVDVQSTEASVVASKSRTSNVTTLVTQDPHGVSVADQVKVTLPTLAAPSGKEITSNVAKLTTPNAHGFSAGDSVTVVLPTAATIVSKQLTSNQATLTTSASHNFAVGDTITVTLPSTASITSKARSGSQVIITTSAAHGFSVNDRVTIAFPTTATPTGTLSADATTNLITVTTTAAHGFSVGDRVLISGSPITSMNGERIIETVPSTTTMTFRDWTITSNSTPAVGSLALTNLTNQTYNGSKILVSASGTSFAYNI